MILAFFCNNLALLKIYFEILGASALIFRRMILPIRGIKLCGVQEDINDISRQTCLSGK